MVVIDSSVLAGIVLRDPVAKGFLDVIPGGRTVDFAQAECLNVIWKYAALLEENTEWMKAVETLAEIWERIEVIPTDEIRARAMEIAVGYRITFYDAAFIAAAEMDGTLASLDRRQKSVARKLDVRTV